MERERKIVVIDDDLEVQGVLEQCIKDMDLGIQVLCVSDPTSAEGIFESYQTPPGLIFLNLWLEDAGEETSGLMLLRHLRQDSRFQRTPIVVVSADERKEIKDECERLGANGFIVKPFDLKEVEAEINKIFSINT